MNKLLSGYVKDMTELRKMFSSIAWTNFTSLMG